MPEINNEFSADQEKQMRSDSRERRAWDGNSWPWQDLQSSKRSPRVPVPEWHKEAEGKEPQMFNSRPDLTK